MPAERPVDPDVPSYHVASEIRRLRKAAGLTQAQLQELLLSHGEPVKQGIISAWERGEHTPGPRRMAKLEHALDAGGSLWQAHQRDADNLAATPNRGNPGWLDRIAVITETATRTMGLIPFPSARSVAHA